MAKLEIEKYKKAVELYQSGLSVAEVASYYDMTRQAMWGILSKRIKLRPRVKFGKENHMYRGGGRFDSRAEEIVAYAIKKRIIVAQPCEVCGKSGVFKDGRSAIYAHHDDYNKPLSVRWLCPKHHHYWHKVNKPIKRAGEGWGKSKFKKELDKLKYRRKLC